MTAQNRFGETISAVLIGSKLAETLSFLKDISVCASIGFTLGKIN
jgi:hypothetical protein